MRDGGKTIVVHLKKGMHWSNGGEITSQDVLFGWKVGMDPATGPYCHGTCDAIEGIDTLDRYTAVFHMKQVYAAAVPLAMPQVWPHVWAGYWNNNAHKAAITLAQSTSFNVEGPGFPTNGPYQVTQVVQNDRIVLRPMKYYSTLSCGGQVKQLMYVFYRSKPGRAWESACRWTPRLSSYLISRNR